MQFRHLSSLAILLALAAGVVGCSHRVAIPKSATDVPGYHNTPPDLRGVDTTPLRGRRILIDPGHGGVFLGAVGNGGLTEAEVNLGVALYLQGLLQWAGADVHLTRTADIDFLSPADSTLASDLAARVTICNNLRPDVFLSIHHNSTANRDPSINETQTYYPLAREGADLDLARAVHRQLVLALEITPAKILPGGFHVLRNTSVPAVLGEPAMLSNPVIEGRLTLARSLELEARAYFLGLLEYFADGTPRWETDLPDTLVVGLQSAVPSWTFEAGSPTAPTIDPTSIVVRADGRDLPYRLRADLRTISVDPEVLREARSLEISARNLRGRVTARRRHILVPDLDGPCTVSAHVASDGKALLHYHISGRDLASGPPFYLDRPHDPEGGLLLPRYPGDQGWAVLDPAPADLAERVLIAHADVPTVIAGSNPTVTMLPDPWRWLCLVADPAVWPDQAVPGGTWRIRDAGPRVMPGASSSSTWPAIPVQAAEWLWLEADGAVPLLLGADGCVPWPSPEPVSCMPDSLHWTPLLPQLIGRRIAIDPRGGGIDEQGRGPFGTRGSDLNRLVATRLAALLQGAGCHVELVRADEIETPDPEKVRRADAFGADLYLALGRGVPAIHHHPGSGIGIPWATACALALMPLLSQTVPVQPATDYVLRHTACPAVVVILEALDDADREVRLQTPAWQDAVARALFRGTVDLLQPGVPTVLMTDLLHVLGRRSIPVDDIDVVRLDGNAVWLPPAGHSASALVPSWATGDPGLPLLGSHHTLELHAGPHWQLWLLNRQPAGDWRGRVFLESH